MRIQILALIAASIFAFVTLPAYADGDPIVGTWVVNTAKSKLDPPPNNVSGSATAKIEKMGDGYSIANISPEGDAGAGYTVLTLDGKDYALGGGAENTTSFIRIDSHNLVSFNKKNGEVIRMQRMKVLKDEKTMEVDRIGYNQDAEGALMAFHHVVIYEKQ